MADAHAAPLELFTIPWLYYKHGAPNGAWGLHAFHRKQLIPFIAKNRALLCCGCAFSAAPPDEKRPERAFPVKFMI